MVNDYLSRSGSFGGLALTERTMRSSSRHDGDPDKPLITAGHE